MPTKVLIGPSTFGSIDSTPLDRLKRAGFDVRQNPFGRRYTKRELRSMLPGVAGLIAGMEPLTRDVLERSELRVISRCGSGLSNVDLKACRDLGIRVLSTPDAPVTSVAELTVGSLIALLRRIPEMNQDLHRGVWRPQHGIELRGKVVLIIGFGRIGRKVAALLWPFEVQVLAVDPALTGVVEGVPVLPLQEALSRADIVLLHASGEEQILGDRELQWMKPGGYVLNAGRGALVNEEALCRVLDAGRLTGAWIDTFSEEPYAGPLIRYPQVILTPHIASATVECRRRMEMEAVENLLVAFAEDGGS